MLIFVCSTDVYLDFRHSLLLNMLRATSISNKITAYQKRKITNGKRLRERRQYYNNLPLLFLLFLKSHILIKSHAEDIGPTVQLNISRRVLVNLLKLTSAMTQ